MDWPNHTMYVLATLQGSTLQFYSKKKKRVKEFQRSMPRVSTMTNPQTVTISTICLFVCSPRHDPNDRNTSSHVRFSILFNPMSWDLESNIIIGIWLGMIETEFKKEEKITWHHRQVQSSLTGRWKSTLSESSKIQNLSILWLFEKKLLGTRVDWEIEREAVKKAFTVPPNSTSINWFGIWNSTGK